MIKDAGSKCDDYSILTKVIQILLHWVYELTKDDFFINSRNYCIKMAYYQFNRKEILQKAKERYSKEKVAEYYLQHKEAIKEKSKNQYKTCQKKKKIRLKSMKERDINN